jgi:hypothetical protein
MMLPLVAAAAACPSLSAEVERATSAEIYGDLDVATEALEEAQASFECAPASAKDLGRYWLVTGVLHKLRGEDPTPWLAASRRVAPDGFDDRFGTELRAAFDGATLSDPAAFTIDPALPAYVDALPVTTWPAPAGAGPHLVQVPGTDTPIRFGHEFALAANEEAVVPTNLAPDALPVPVDEPPGGKKHHTPAFLIASAAAAVAGGGLAWAAVAHDDALANATSKGELNAAFDRQTALGWGAYGLWGVAGVSLGLNFVIR